MARDTKTGTLPSYSFVTVAAGHVSSGGSGNGGDGGRQPPRGGPKGHNSDNKAPSRKRKAKEQDEEESDDETQSEVNNEGKGKGGKPKKAPNASGCLLETAHMTDREQQPRRPANEDDEDAEYRFHNGDLLVLPDPIACVLPATTRQLTRKQLRRYTHAFKLVLQWIHLNRQAYAISRDNGMLGQNRAVMQKLVESQGSIEPSSGMRHKYRKDADGKSCKDSITKMRNSIKKFYPPWYNELARYERDGPKSLAGAGASGSGDTVSDAENERRAQQEEANAAELKEADTRIPLSTKPHVQPEVPAPVLGSNERPIRTYTSFPTFSSSRMSYYTLPDPIAGHGDLDESLPPGGRRLAPTSRVGDGGAIQKTSNRRNKGTKRGSKRDRDEEYDWNALQEAGRRDRLRSRLGGTLLQPLQPDPRDPAPLPASPPQAAVRRARRQRLMGQDLSQPLPPDQDPFFSPEPTPQAAPTSTSGGTAATNLAAAHATAASDLNPAEFAAYMAEMARMYRESRREGGGSG